MRISDYLDRRFVLFLDATTRDDAIDSLIHVLESELPDKAAFRKAIFHREGLVSTGIGMGVAVPHAKLGDLKDFFIAIGIQQKRGIEWNALDQAPVRLVFLIGGPDNKQSEYLKILSQLTRAIKDSDFRKELMQAHSVQEVIDLFSQY